MSNVTQIRGRGRPVNSGKKFRFNGKNQTLREWAQTLGFSYITLYNRVVLKKMRTRDAFVRPLHARKTTREAIKQIAQAA